MTIDSQTDNIGVVLKKIRIKKNMSQESLAKGLCSRKQLSRIERKLSNPSSYLLKEFSYRLGENLCKYTEFLYCQDPIAMYELVSELEQLFSKGHYTTMDNKLESLTYTHTQTISECFLSVQIIEWYRFVANFHLKIYDYSFSKLVRLFKLTSDREIHNYDGGHYSKYELRILYSVAQVQYSQHNNDASKKLLVFLISYVTGYCYDRDHIILTQLYYLYASILMNEKQYKEALDIIGLGEHLIINHCNFSLLSNFTYSKGNCYEHLGFEKKSLKLYARALSLRSYGR